MRIFIAAVLPENIKSHISNYVNSIKDSIDGVKWEDRTKYHITLKFIGSIDSKILPRINNLLTDRLNGENHIFMELTHFLGFPNLKHPRVLAAGFKKSVELNHIHSYIEDHLGKLGFVKDSRSFKPHVTLGRVKSRFLVRNALPVIEPILFDIERLEVFESILSSGGAVYKSHFSYDFAKKN
jgi:2'-5' RNA ligase